MSQLTELNLVVSTLIQDIKTTPGGLTARDELNKLFAKAAAALHNELDKVIESQQELRTEPSKRKAVSKPKKKE